MAATMSMIWDARRAKRGHEGRILCGYEVRGIGYTCPLPVAEKALWSADEQDSLGQRA